MPQSAPKTTLTVNLLKDPNPDQKIVKASLIDKKSIDLAMQRQAAEERQKQEAILAEQRRVEEIKNEAEKAKLALEVAAKKAAAEKAKLAQQQIEMKKQIAEQQIQAKKDLEKKQEATKQAAAKQAAAKQAALKQAEALRAQQAAGLKAQQDHLAAQHQEFLVSEVEKYRSAFQVAIEDNRILSSVFAGNISCKIRIKLLPDGSIHSVNVIETSGNPAYDEMSTTAVYKSAPFPMPQDQELYTQLRDIVLSFRNGEQSTDAL